MSSCIESALIMEMTKYVQSARQHPQPVQFQGQGDTKLVQIVRVEQVDPQTAEKQAIRKAPEIPTPTIYQQSFIFDSHTISVL